MGPFKNIFAIEGEWEHKLDDNLTILSGLSLLQEMCDIKYIFRKVNTADSLLEYIKESRKTRYHTYDIIYLAFHGTKNEIQISKNNAISLEEFAESCPNWFEGKYVHFSSCSVGKSMSLKEFKKITGAYAVSSFTKEIPFFESAVFDLVLLQKLTQYEKIGYLDKYFNDNFEYLYNKLGFVLLK